MLDEATARMDPVTEARVTRASERLLAGRTGLLIAHRLTTTMRADQVAVLDSGRVVQQGSRVRLAQESGPFRELLAAAGRDADAAPDGDRSVGTARRVANPRTTQEVGTGPSLTRNTVSMLRLHPRWGLVGGALFLLSSMVGAFGAITGFLWGSVVEQLQDGGRPVQLSSDRARRWRVKLIRGRLDGPALQQADRSSSWTQDSLSQSDGGRSSRRTAATLPADRPRS